MGKPGGDEDGKQHTYPQAMQPAIQAIHAYEADTGYTWQQRGPLRVSCAA